MLKGSHIYNEERAIVVEKDALCLVFDNKIKRKNGYICRIILSVKPDNKYCFATVREGGKQDINDLHKKFGHVSKAIICAMAKHYNWPLLTNKLIACESCALAKSHQKNTNTEPLGQSKTSGKWLFINVSSIKDQSFGSQNSGSLQLTMPPILLQLFSQVKRSNDKNDDFVDKNSPQ